MISYHIASPSRAGRSATDDDARAQRSAEDFARLIELRRESLARAGKNASIKAHLRPDSAEYGQHTLHSQARSRVVDPPLHQLPSAREHLAAEALAFVTESPSDTHYQDALYATQAIHQRSSKPFAQNEERNLELSQQQSTASNTYSNSVFAKRRVDADRVGQASVDETKVGVNRVSQASGDEASGLSLEEPQWREEQQSLALSDTTLSTRKMFTHSHLDTGAGSHIQTVMLSGDRRTSTTPTASFDEPRTATGSVAVLAVSESTQSQMANELSLQLAAWDRHGAQAGRVECRFTVMDSHDCRVLVEVSRSGAEDILVRLKPENSYCSADLEALAQRLFALDNRIEIQTLMPEGSEP